MSITTTSISANQVSLQFGDVDDFVGNDVEALVVIAVILIELSEKDFTSYHWLFLQTDFLMRQKASVKNQTKYRSIMLRL